MLGLIACLASTRLRYPVEIDCLIRFDDSSITRYRFFSFYFFTLPVCCVCWRIKLITTPRMCYGIAD